MRCVGAWLSLPGPGDRHLGRGAALAYIDTRERDGAVAAIEELIALASLCSKVTAEGERTLSRRTLPLFRTLGHSCKPVTNAATCL